MAGRICTIAAAAKLLQQVNYQPIIRLLELLPQGDELNLGPCHEKVVHMRHDPKAARAVDVDAGCRLRCLDLQLRHDSSHQPLPYGWRVTGSVHRLPQNPHLVPAGPSFILLRQSDEDAAFHISIKGTLS